MTEGHRPSLGRVVDDLGSTLLKVVAGPPEADLRVSSVSIYDPADGVTVAPGGILLGVGVTDIATVASLLAQLERCEGAALLLKTPAPLDDGIRETALRSGVCVLEVSRAASWEQLVVLLRTLLDPPEFGDPDEEIAGYPAGDLFQLANAVGALLDSAVTIEDRSSRVLAFSSGQENTDEGRVETVLGRQVPERHTRTLTEMGIFQQLYRSKEPVYVPAITDSALPRTAIAVRAGDEVLGFLWAVVSEPLTEHRKQAFIDATKIVALHLLRERAGSSVDARLRAELVARLFDRSGDPAEAARRLGVRDKPVCVLGLELAATADDDEVKRAAEIRRVADALALHLSALHRSAAATTLGDVVYGLLPVSGKSDGEAMALRVAEDFLERMGTRVALRVGIGRVACAPEGIVRSRTDADVVLRVLRETGRAERCATVRSVRLDLLLLRLAEISGSDDGDHDGAVTSLLTYDAEHRSDLTGTLAAYLEAFGDIAKASAAVHIHPNTFRYRLNRLCEISGLDLTDPDARFEALIDLRLHRLRRMPAAG
ncbi:PucR family transcriptional regulator [Amycolatopsis sp. NPDC059021]|uniref:PucR family transcriptional regulator n=1 Tax=Amycolatopsis sp. NPDC059021 TaxID=3346704 RepID=UPI00366C155F